VKRPSPRFIVVLDQATALLPLPEVARAAIAGGADLVQVREKSLDHVRLRQVAREVISAIGDPLLVSLNTDAALASDLGTNLHLPEHAEFDQSATPLNAAALVGRSIHGAAAAVEAEVDYLVLGNLFDTASKPGKSGLGVERFAAIVRRSALPVLAIGGIRPETAEIALEAGADGLAVSSHVNASDDPERAAREIKEAIDKWKS
jgi:thiamine-phosphate diphosphorylase